MLPRNFISKGGETRGPPKTFSLHSCYGGAQSHDEGGLPETLFSGISTPNDVPTLSKNPIFIYNKKTVFNIVEQKQKNYI